MRRTHSNSPPPENSKDAIPNQGASEDCDVEHLYTTRAGKIAATLRKMFGDGPPDPNDVTQQAFENLMKRKDRSDIRDPGAFIWRTARNLILEEKRRDDIRSQYDYEIAHIFFPSQGVDSSPENIISAREQLKAINEALGKMPEKRRRAFILNRVEGLSISEVARQLRIARSPATRHVTRAMQDIQIHLAKRRRDKQT